MHFVETMRGQLTCLATGREHPLCFHVRAERQQGSCFGLTGVLHAAPWVDEAVAHGTLTMGALPPRIAYDVRFQARGGHALRLVGAKHPTPLAPVASMSRLRCALEDVATGAALGHGELRFDLLDLPRFLASWLPGRSLEHRRLAARHQAVTRRALLEG